MKNKVTILLATYNGGKYIKEQLDSIVNQSYSNWELLIRDDCSSDNTIEIIAEYIKIDNRIKIHPNDNKRLGASQNFSSLMSLPILSSYIMFCDQDDIWLENKIEKSLCAIKALGKDQDSNKSLMVYGTYCMIDDDGKDLQLAIPDYSLEPRLDLLLSQNYIYGCTMMITKDLAESSIPIPLTAENHDYWITLMAVLSMAKIAYINEPLLLYRQHSNNVSGSYKDSSFINRINRIINSAESKSIKSRLKMFVSLQERCKDLNIENRLLNGYITSVSQGGIKALLYCLQNGIRRRGLLQTVLFYFNLLKTNKS